MPILSSTLLRYLDQKIRPYVNSFFPGPWAVRYYLCKAIKVDPEDVTLRFHLATLYIELSDYERAAETYEIIQQLWPDNAEAVKAGAKTLFSVLLGENAHDHADMITKVADSFMSLEHYNSALKYYHLLESLTDTYLSKWHSVTHPQKKESMMYSSQVKLSEEVSCLIYIKLSLLTRADYPYHGHQLAR